MYTRKYVVTHLHYVNQMKEVTCIPNKLNITYYLSILFGKKVNWYSE